MKSFGLVAAVYAAAVLSTSAEKCVLTKLVDELEPITAMVYACYDDTGYAVIPPRANPTAAQTFAVCTKCTNMIATAKTMKFATCTFEVSGVDIPLNEWMPKIIGMCDNTTAAAGITSNTRAVNSTNTVAPTTMTPTTGSASAVTSLSVAAVAVGSVAVSFLL